MLFNSLKFLIFFPAVVLLYFVLPKRVRNLWLLVASYVFYMGWNAKYVVLLFTSTLITYLSGLLLERVKDSDRPETKKTALKKWVVAVSFLLNLGILFYFKYVNFFLDTLGAAASLVGLTLNVPKFDILLPVGISFFTFQALSYTVDVYRGEIGAEKNFLRYALFVSFFPQLVAGPIERSKNLLQQLDTPKSFDFDRAREGFVLMLWGYFLKIVLADRIAIFVDTVYGDIAAFPGWYLIAATVLFAVQIYCDFGGYSTIAMGAAKILGIELMENFDAPYLSTSVSQFWRRWHISLTSWFKDYLYIPLGGSRKGKLRKYINKMIVFLVSGLWHGADATFVIWGGLNGLYQVLGEALAPARDKASIPLALHLPAHRLFLDFLPGCRFHPGGQRHPLDLHGGESLGALRRLIVWLRAGPEKFHPDAAGHWPAVFGGPVQAPGPGAPPGAAGAGLVGQDRTDRRRHSGPAGFRQMGPRLQPGQLYLFPVLGGRP